MNNRERKELFRERTGNTKVFENQDHSITREIYFHPIHYQEEDGSFQEMDDRMGEETAEEAGYANKKGKWKVHFKKQAKEQKTVSITMGDYRLDWGIQGAEKVKARMEDEKKLFYPEIQKGLDVWYRVYGETVKENLILTAPEAPHKITFLYQLKNLTAVLEQNQISFRNADEEEILVLAAPCMTDASGQYSEDMTLDLKPGKKKGQYEITLTADEGWLKEEGRSYPVTLDPAITTSKKEADIYDAHIDSKNAGTNYRNGIFLKTMGGDNIQRSFLKFTLPEIKTGDMVVSARLVLVSLAQDGLERSIEVHRVLQSWNDSTLTWNNRPAYEETVEDLCRYTGDKQKYVFMDITRLVKDWYQNGKNYGLMLKDSRELARYTEFLSSDCHEGYQNMRPYIEISYRNYSGLEDFWSYHSQDAGRAGVCHVNDYNGNVILERIIFSTGGNRMPMALTQVYNTNDAGQNIGYGYGWRLGYHQTIEKVAIGGKDYYKYVDGNGTAKYFYNTQTDSTKPAAWKDENSQELTLEIQASSSTERYIIRSKDNYRLIFNSAGLLVKLKDNNDNAVSVTYESGHITKLVDGAGRTAALAYQKVDNQFFLSKVTLPSKDTVAFAYTSGNLTAITDVDGQKISYTYNGKRYLKSAANVDGYEIRYVYYTTIPYRTKTIAEYSGGTAGKSLTLTYGHNSTKFTDNKGKSEIERFDYYGNLLHIHDGFGHAASAKYSRESNQVNRLENVTSLQSNVIQLLKDPIMQASASGWTSKLVSGTASAKISENGVAKIGKRALYLESDNLTSNICWYQNVKIRKGGTYTFSVYARSVVEALGEGGKCFVRVHYKDKDGNFVMKDGDALTRTAADFRRLQVICTIPSDSAWDYVMVSMYLYHIKGRVYWDMAQLETGKTPNRCNLVDNGDFYLGNSDGFTRIVCRPEDRLVTVGKQAELPVQKNMVVTVSSTGLYTSPNTASTKKADLTKGTHVAEVGCFTGSDGAVWHHVFTAGDLEGYIKGNDVLAYVSGGEGVRAGLVAVSNAVLRSSASSTGTAVLSYIPRGTNVVINGEATDSSKKKWYRTAFSLDTSRYNGYLPADSVALLGRNAASAVMKEADSLFKEPSLSVATSGSLAKGRNFSPRGILKKQNGETWYVIYAGKEYTYLPS